MRVVKSISLPVDLAQKAENFENLSLYVQDAIKYGIEHNLQEVYKAARLANKRAFEAEDLIHAIIDLMGNKRKTLANYDKIIDLLVDAHWLERIDKNDV